MSDEAKLAADRLWHWTSPKFDIPLELKRDLTAAIKVLRTQAAPEGWVLVPREATDAWAEGFCEFSNWDPDGTQDSFVEGQLHSVTFRDLAKGYIHAVIAAAPKEKP